MIIGVIISAGLYPLIQAFSKIIGCDMFWRRRKDTDWFPRDVEYLSTKRRIISMFFMVTYGAICLISVLEHFAADPSYRPTFKSRWYISAKIVAEHQKKARPVAAKRCSLTSLCRIMRMMMFNLRMMFRSDIPNFNH